MFFIFEQYTYMTDTSPIFSTHTAILVQLGYQDNVDIC